MGSHTPFSVTGEALTPGPDIKHYFNLGMAFNETQHDRQTNLAKSDA